MIFRFERHQTGTVEIPDTDANEDAMRDLGKDLIFSNDQLFVDYESDEVTLEGA